MKKDYLPFVRTYLLVTAAATFAIGVILLFWPEQILQWFIPGATGDFFVRFIGSALVGYSVLNTLAAETKDYYAQEIALIANLVTLSIATCLSIYGVVSGQITSMTGLLIGEHIVFTVGFAICLYLQKK